MDIGENVADGILTEEYEKGLLFELPPIISNKGDKIIKSNKGDKNLRTRCQNLHERENSCT